MTEENKVDEQEEKKDDVVTPDAEDKCAGGTCGTDCCSIGGGKNIIVWLVIVVLVVAGIAYFQMKKKDAGAGEAKPVSEKTSQEVKATLTEMIDGKLVPAGTKVEIGDIVEESGLYKMVITVEGQEVTSYLTKDMTKFIPQLIEKKDLEKDTEEKTDGEGASAPAADVQAKSDKPEVEIFVMSHCPYGTQVEKGILPALDTLGNTINAKFKFVDYAMHGEEEVTEQLRQYCIQEKEPQKFRKYLACFLGSKDATACMSTTGVNQTILAQCATKTDADFKVKELLNDKASWVSGQFPQFNIFKEDNKKYGVQGSPTLVINGEIIQSGRDSASLLKAICSAFKTQPAACAVELSTEEPAPGFGQGKAAAGTTDAACATPTE